MKMFAIICTREVKLPMITNGLVNTLSNYGVDVKLLAKQSSIFEAYERGLRLCDAKDEDIIIFCHDDLQILSSHTQFIAALSKCVEKTTGIVGPAGTTLLGEDSVWWNQDHWAAGYHRGMVKHKTLMKFPPLTHKPDQIRIEDTEYGPYGPVVVLDGLFLAARKEVWVDVGLQKPDYFEGNWDFYDIHYTSTAHKKGYTNYAIPINLVHMSNGELVGRDSWHKNRKAFIANTNLPLSC